ncbi:hypothetical protein B005_1102 [Nocardiopsis alba ATCC BAA-2165]|uniref:Uncharacterized protein n=1 Tax=Nocardiopsis alba (strain ATCC BAA-2165 / BE74) TaxID=1205910 RepID=J7L697_NOCAA|nr:hypothetical protein B005_1102 [Nocardiopsis alba ATCC BAA-2165]
MGSRGTSDHTGGAEGSRLPWRPNTRRSEAEAQSKHFRTLTTAGCKGDTVSYTDPL